jgi:hypothetical protein
MRWFLCMRGSKNTRNHQERENEANIIEAGGQSASTPHFSTAHEADRVATRATPRHTERDRHGSKGGGFRWRHDDDHLSVHQGGARHA